MEDDETLPTYAPHGFSTTLLIEGLPRVNSEKKNKLTAYVKKLVEKFGKVVAEQWEVDEDGAEGDGFVLLEMQNEKQVNDAADMYNGYAFDKNHTLAAINLENFDTVLSSEDNYEQPTRDDGADVGHLKSWLTDYSSRDQFVTLIEEEAIIQWNQKAELPERVYSRDFWTETYLQWSPLGTYLTTFHRGGLALWGGPNWTKIARLVTPEVKYAQFSPCENYVVTWSPRPIEENKNLGIWSIKTQTLLKAFECNAKTIEWPIFFWSPDDAYVAREVTPGNLSVYSLPTMTLSMPAPLASAKKPAESKPMRIEDLKDFSWSPKDLTIAYWVSETENSPARVTVLSMPSREIVRSKNLFSVSDCALFWQSNGDYLACKLDRLAKNKKSKYPSLEIFRVREKGIPIDVLEFKEPMPIFAWEPKGSRFIVVLSELNKVVINIYNVDKDKINLLKTMERKNISSVHWNPLGRFVVLANLGRGPASEIEFYDTEENISYATVEHYMADNIEWDPTGRYLVSSVSYWMHANDADTGYMITDFKGTVLSNYKLPRLKAILWRPRPPTMLSNDAVRKVKKNLREYSKIFSEEDTKASSRVSEEVMLRRERLLAEWSAWQEEALEEYRKHDAERAELMRGILDDEEDDEEETEEDTEWIEELVDEKTQML